MDRIKFKRKLHTQACTGPRLVPTKIESKICDESMICTVKFHKTTNKEEQQVIVKRCKWLKNLIPYIRQSYKTDPQCYFMEQVIKLGYDATNTILGDDLNTFCVDEHETLLHQGTLDLGNNCFQVIFQTIIPNEATEYVIEHFFEKSNDKVWPYNDLVKEITEECWWPDMMRNIREWADKKNGIAGTKIYPETQPSKKQCDRVTQYNEDHSKSKKTRGPTENLPSRQLKQTSSETKNILS